MINQNLITELKTEVEQQRKLAEEHSAIAAQLEAALQLIAEPPKIFTHPTSYSTIKTQPLKYSNFKRAEWRGLTYTQIIPKVLAKSNQSLTIQQITEQIFEPIDKLNHTSAANMLRSYLKRAVCQQEIIKKQDVSSGKVYYSLKTTQPTENPSVKLNSIPVGSINWSQYKRPEFANISYAKAAKEILNNYPSGLTIDQLVEKIFVGYTKEKRGSLTLTLKAALNTYSARKHVTRPRKSKIYYSAK